MGLNAVLGWPQASWPMSKKNRHIQLAVADDELDLLGDGNRDSFTGSNADLESGADNLPGIYLTPTSTPPTLQFIVCYCLTAET